MKKIKALVAASALAMMTGCSYMPLGVVFSSIKHPGTYHPGYTTNPGASPLYGESCSMSILGAIALGDWSIDAALRAAGAEGKTLKNVAIDHPTLNILGLYGKYCTSVSALVAG
jgi:hypothetical protein